MAEDERLEPAGEDASGLELPSLRSALGFGRKRHGEADATEGSVPEPDTEEPAEPDHPEPAPAETGGEASARRRRRGMLHVPGPVVASLTGAVVGLVLVGLTSASLHLCTAVRGTSSCGKPGALLLLVIAVAVVLLGSVLLRLFGVDPHGSTSFLGVGLLVVLILIALLPVVDRWWMVIVIPAIAMATYMLSWWLTTTYVEPGERPR